MTRLRFRYFTLVADDYGGARGGSNLSPSCQLTATTGTPGVGPVRSTRRELSLTAAKLSAVKREPRRRNASDEPPADSDHDKIMPSVTNDD